MASALKDQRGSPNRQETHSFPRKHPHRSSSPRPESDHRRRGNRTSEHIDMDRKRSSNPDKSNHSFNRDHRFRHNEERSQQDYAARERLSERHEDYPKNILDDDDKSLTSSFRGVIAHETHSNLSREANMVVSKEECTSENTGCTTAVDWKAHRNTLNGLFFRDEDTIKRGTKEYDDFWAFLERYEEFEKKKVDRKATTTRSVSGGQRESSSVEAQFGIPRNYDRRHRTNVSLSSKELAVRLRRYLDTVSRRRDNRDIESFGPSLTSAQLDRFQMILEHFYDFLQKQKFTRLLKVRRDQRNLPIYQFKEDIVNAVKQNQVVVVAGDTGCGKSTQVPQYLLEAGFTNIACTQPRRIACISLSKRVSYETLNEYGSEVAFQVRFEKTRTARTRILFLTEGLLLRQIEGDPTLSRYGVIVVDEVHERHIHTDFLLGVIKCILHQRADLKLVLMSATINIELFSGYFNDAPVCKVPGRLFPIQLQYIPRETADTRVEPSTGSKAERLDPSPYLRILQLIDKKYPAKERGDVLIFLSGLSEIMAVVEAAREYAQKAKSWIVLPLHSALSISDQDKVFDFPPEGVRKCIVSTNIAETSVTIDGVRFVVDSGKVKEMSFDSKYKMQKLQEFWISRASAEQRKGRAGRTGPGVCYRLYSEADYDALQEYSTPEIQRVPLDSLVLQMISMGLEDARRFPFIEPPLRTRMETSIAFLKEQGALTDDEKLTSIGEMLAKLPVDVVIGKMLIMASVFEMVDPVVTIAAALCIQSVFTARATRDYDACTLRRSLESDHGDPITLLNCFDAWVQVKADGGDSRKWCRKRGLEEQRFYEMNKLKQQFSQLLGDHGLLDDGRRRAEGPDNDDKDTFVPPAERKRKHAERKQLAQLRVEQRKHGKKRKVLKMDEDEYNFAADDDDEDDGMSRKVDEFEDLEGNIKDLEFRLTNDLNRLEELSNKSRSLTSKDITVLKVILCSGLYPQVAIADEHNSFKAESEQAFHTKSKGFVLLHPTSVFATNPESLQLKDTDVKEVTTEVKRSNRSGILSNRHQLLAYVSIVETTKPYLTGTLRVPALQTLLLFTNCLDTNEDGTRVVCDGWIELRFETVEDAEMMLAAVVRLRATWHQLLKQKLDSGGRRAGVDGVADRRKIRRTQSILSAKLSEFLHSDVYYWMRRVHAAEAQHLYRGPDDVGQIGIEGEPCILEDKRHLKKVLDELMTTGGKPHPYKGGIQVTSYLVYNCLVSDDSASAYGDYTACMQRHWTCDQCHASLIVTLAERLAHEQECQRLTLTSNATAGVSLASGDTARHDGLDGARRRYHCAQCKCDFKFTTVETLKHKKSCTGRTKEEGVVQ